MIRKIYERRVSKNYKNIFVTDIDETLLHSNFDSLGPTKWPDAQIQYSTITNATPNIPLLQVMDKYINDGYDVAFLTARSSYKTTLRALKKFLMYRDLNGDLQPIDDVLEDDFSFAVNDNEQHSYIGEATPDRKAEIVASLCELYDNVVFADDSNSNLTSVRRLINRYDNLTIIDAKAECNVNNNSRRRFVEARKNADESFANSIEKLLTEYMTQADEITELMNSKELTDGVADEYTQEQQVKYEKFAEHVSVDFPNIKINPFFKVDEIVGEYFETLLMKQFRNDMDKVYDYMRPIDKEVDKGVEKLKKELKKQANTTNKIRNTIDKLSNKNIKLYNKILSEIVKHSRGGGVMPNASQFTSKEVWNAFKNAVADAM